MEINALMMDAKDNVVTCVEEIEAGQRVVYRKGDEILSVTAQEAIPYCHKIALENIPEGAEVIKYGELLGKTSAPIGKGRWVSHENIYSVPRDYDSEFIR